MLSARATRLAVWGDPIAHSRSPQLHAAAYRALGIDWSYDRRRVGEASFPATLTGLDDTWRGLSLTYPLKSAAFAAATALDAPARLTGAVNTLLLADEGPRGFNTDVGGIVAALGDEGVRSVETARIVGAGATATSAIVALAQLGARSVEVVARRPEAVRPLSTLGERLSITVVSHSFENQPHTEVDLTVATLPGDAALASATADALAATGGPLLDVVYGHWPTVLSGAWDRAGARSASGLGMLLHQAVRQVRVFVAGDPDAALDDEAAVVAAMRSALVED